MLNQYRSEVPTLSTHARRRMAQRNVKIEHVQFVLDYGTPYHVAGTLHVYLRRKDIPQHRRHDPALMRLEGLAVVLCREASTVLTVWRNRQNGNKHIKHKSTYGY